MVSFNIFRVSVVVWSITGQGKRGYSRYISESEVTAVLCSVVIVRDTSKIGFGFWCVSVKHSWPEKTVV